MSLDVYLDLPGTTANNKGSGIFVREGGRTVEISRQEWDARFPDKEPVVAVGDDDESESVYAANITHNLDEMAMKAEIYGVVWRPDENGITQASQLIGPIEEGLKKLRDDPEKFKAHNPPNGWGDYDGLVEFIEQYLAACKKWPTALVWVSR